MVVMLMILMKVLVKINRTNIDKTKDTFQERPRSSMLTLSLIFKLIMCSMQIKEEKRGINFMSQPSTSKPWAGDMKPWIHLRLLNLTNIRAGNKNNKGSKNLKKEELIQTSKSNMEKSWEDTVPQLLKTSLMTIDTIRKLRKSPTKLRIECNSIS